ncbi:MAG: hypothetical protein ACKOA1_04990 [Bacteroidota bacterium]
MKNQENTLIGQHAYPAISLLVPTHPAYPKFKLDRKHMVDLVKNAENQLSDRFSKHLTHELVGKLNETVNAIDFTSLSHGLAVYVSQHHSKVVHLPFEVEEKVIVDDSFEVRDLQMAAQMHREYLLVLISKNAVRTAVGNGISLVPVKYKDMPADIQDVTNSHSLPGWDYLDTEAYDEKNTRNYLRFIDDVLTNAVKGNELPVIIMGDNKMLGIYRSGTSLGDRIVGYIEGNFEHATVPQIHDRVMPVLKKMDDESEAKAFNVLSGALSKGDFCGGIVEVWRAAVEGRGRLLLVESSYQQKASMGDDLATLVVGQEPAHGYRKVADAVDDVIEKVIEKGGKVQFVEDGRLTDYDRIALVTRF